MEELNCAHSIGKPIRILMKTDPRFQGVPTFEKMKKLTPAQYRWVFESVEVIPFQMKRKLGMTKARIFRPSPDEEMQVGRVVVPMKKYTFPLGLSEFDVFVSNANDDQSTASKIGKIMQDSVRHDKDFKIAFDPENPHILLL